MAQVLEKDVLKCTIAVDGELCVMMDSLMHLRESFVTCLDTGTRCTLCFHLRYTKCSG